MRETKSANRMQAAQRFDQTDDNCNDRVENGKLLTVSQPENIPKRLFIDRSVHVIHVFHLLIRIPK